MSCEFSKEQLFYGTLPVATPASIVHGECYFSNIKFHK